MEQFKPYFSKDPFSEGFYGVLNKLKIPQFSQKDTPFSPRMLNYYDGKELLLYSAEKGKKRLFTAEQLFWILILNETGKFNYNLIENLQDIKHRIENIPIVDGRFDKFNYLQYVLAHIIYHQTEHHLKIDADGSFDFFSYHNLQKKFQEDNLLGSSHMDIALGPITKRIWKSLTGEDLQFKKPSFSTTIYKNKELIEILEKGDFEYIEIVRKSDGSNQVNIIERNVDPATCDLSMALSRMQNTKITINNGDIPGKAVSMVKEKRVRAKK